MGSLSNAPILTIPNNRENQNQILKSQTPLWIDLICLNVEGDKRTRLLSQGHNSKNGLHEGEYGQQQEAAGSVGPAGLAQRHVERYSENWRSVLALFWWKNPRVLGMLANSESHNLFCTRRQTVKEMSPRIGRRRRCKRRENRQGVEVEWATRGSFLWVGLHQITWPPTLPPEIPLLPLPACCLRQIVCDNKRKKHRKCKKKGIRLQSQEYRSSSSIHYCE